MCIFVTDFLHILECKGQMFDQIMVFQPLTFNVHGVVRTNYLEIIRFFVHCSMKSCCDEHVITDQK